LFEQFKALEFELKMDLQIKKKKRKEKEKTSLSPTLLGAWPVSLGRGLALSPTLPTPYPSPALGCHV